MELCSYALQTAYKATRIGFFNWNGGGGLARIVILLKAIGKTDYDYGTAVATLVIV